MTLYILRRLVQLIPVLLLASFIVFFIIHLIPGDPVEVMLGEGRYSQETYELLRKKMGLDEPLHIQYLHWLNRILTVIWANLSELKDPCSTRSSNATLQPSIWLWLLFFSEL